MYIRLHVYSMEIQWRHSVMKHRQHNALDKKLNVIQHVRMYVCAHYSEVGCSKYSHGQGLCYNISKMSSESKAELLCCD